MSYSRPVTPITWQYYSGEPAGYAIANANAITFPPAGLGGWGVINGLGLWRDPTDVTMLFYSALDFSSFEVNDGDTVTIQSEGIKIRLDRIL